MHSINLSGDSNVSTVILREIEENTQHDLEYEESVHDFAKSNSIEVREHYMTIKRKLYPFYHFSRESNVSTVILRGIGEN